MRVLSVIIALMYFCAKRKRYVNNSWPSELLAQLRPCIGELLDAPVLLSRPEVVTEKIPVRRAAQDSQFHHKLQHAIRLSDHTVLSYL